LQRHQPGLHIVPIIRYFCLVGPFLLGLLFLQSNPDKPATVPAPDRWNSIDSLRAMAHLGEPVEGHAATARFVRREQAEPASRDQLAEPAAQGKSLIMNAQANMDAAGMNSQRTTKQSTAVKPRKQKMATRQVRLHTAAAENAQRVSPEIFRPPSW
jgi:hypothetical protein